MKRFVSWVAKVEAWASEVKVVVASAPPRERRTFLPAAWHVLMSLARSGQERRPVALFAAAALEALAWQAAPKFTVGKPPGPKKVVKKARTMMLVDWSAQSWESLTWFVAGVWP